MDSMVDTYATELDQEKVSEERCVTAINDSPER